MVQSRTIGEQILEKVGELVEEIDEIKRRLGDESMEPIDRRLKRIETKIHAAQEGKWQNPPNLTDDGLNKRL